MANRTNTYWFGEMITSMLLCNHFNPESDTALQKCLYRFVQRCPVKTIQSVAWHVIGSQSPLQWLQNRIDSIQQQHGVNIHMFLKWTTTGDTSCLTYYQEA